jgi:hypothetical protein
MASNFLCKYQVNEANTLFEKQGGSHFVDYNFRKYVHRIAKEDFRKYANERDPKIIQVLYERGVEQLGVVQRQAINNQMYARKLNVIDLRSKKLFPQQDL